MMCVRVYYTYFVAGAKMLLKHSFSSTTIKMEKKLKDLLLLL